jgi:hypothetical protein
LFDAFDQTPTIFLFDSQAVMPVSAAAAVSSGGINWGGDAAAVVVLVIESLNASDGLPAAASVASAPRCGSVWVGIPLVFDMV